MKPVRVRVSMRLVRKYCIAQLLLRREMEKPPALGELLAHEFSQRTVRDIVEDYLEGGVGRKKVRAEEVQLYRNGRRLESV